MATAEFVPGGPTADFNAFTRQCNPTKEIFLEYATWIGGFAAYADSKPVETTPGGPPYAAEDHQRLV